MKSFIKKDWLFLGILFIQLFVLIFTFAFFKQGYHSDELYEYGFANSYDLRVLEMDNNGVGLDRQWTDSKDLLNYISVEKDHRFSYSNIFKHASMDYYNPPLKLFLLHTICSFFPGIFSKWFSFSINIVSFIVIQVFLYLLVKKMTKSIPAAVACISLFGFGAGCFNSMMFLRMYAMGMALGTVFLYYSYMYFVNDQKQKSIVYLLISFLSLFAGAYTLHLFLVYAFPIVLVISISYLILKKIKKMLAYGFTCLGAVILSFLAFPQTVNDTMQSVDSYSYSISKYSDFMQFRIYTFLATMENFGFHTSMYANPWIKNSIAIFLFIAILCVPLFIFFRKEEWFKKFLKNLKNKVVSNSKDIGYNFVFLLAFVVCIFFVIYIASVRTSIYTMNIKYSTRYIYMVFPVICVFATVTFFYIIKFLIPNKKVISVIVVSVALFLATLSQILNYEPYLMIYEKEGVTLDQIEPNANCYILLLSNWFMVSLTNELYDTNSYYFVNYGNYENETACFENVDRDKPLYFILDCSLVITDEVQEIMDDDPDSMYNVAYSDVMIKEEDIINHYESLDDVESIEFVGKDCIFDRTIRIYRVNLN